MLAVKEAPAREAEARESKTISSYKCEDCGKIIAVPGENPAPRCCGDDMRKIR